MGIVLLLIAALGHSNYKRAERVAELTTAVKSSNYFAYLYMLNYARCMKKLKGSNETSER